MRLKLIILYAWRMDKDALVCSLRPVLKRRTNALGKLLKNRGIIDWNEKNWFSYQGIKIFYSGTPPFLAFLSLLSESNKYIKKNFSNNIVLSIEGAYEKHGSILQEGDYVIDAGANFGLFSVLASTEIGPQGRVFAFEPVQETYNLLQRTIQENQLDNIQLIKKALGENNKDLEFLLFNSLGHSSNFNLNNNKIRAKEVVKQSSLDEFVQKNNLERVDFIKSDIEGMERYLLKGAE